MKTFKTSIAVLAALIVISLAACKKSGTSPSSKTSQLTFQLQADNSTNLASTSANNQTNSTVQGLPGLTFTSAIANVARFKFEAKRNGVEIEVSSKNLSNVDLFALSPAVAGVTIDTGIYREIEIKVMLEHTADTTALPLKLKGTYTNSQGTAVPFEFDLNDDATIKAEVENITVTSTTDFLALVHLHLLRLEAGVTSANLDAATLTKGVLVVSKTSNTSIYNRVLANFTNCGEGEFREHHKGGNEDNGNDGSGHH